MRIRIFVLLALFSAPDFARQEIANRLVSRAVLRADTFAEGPTTGQYLGRGPINGKAVPITDRQPVQGFSSIHDIGDGSYLVLSDNGFGAIENSADYLLRIYRIRPDFDGGGIFVLGYTQLRDPEGRCRFAIVHEFTEERFLTGADFDPESLQVAPDGTLWIGDEFGPFLLHFDPEGRLLDEPFRLPDLDHPGKEIRAPQNPFGEEGSTLRVMNAMRAHAERHGNHRSPVVSPWHLMLADGDPDTFVPGRRDPPEGSGLAPASSEIVDAGSLRNAGFAVVPYTVNTKARMTGLLRLGVDGIISDRPDLLYETIAEYDADGDGKPGDYLLPDGRIDRGRIDAQGHRGARNVRPENTLPAMEAALDVLVTTLELDCGLTRDGSALLSHEPYLAALNARFRAPGQGLAGRIDANGNGFYEPEEEVLISGLSHEEIRGTFVFDKLLPDRPHQRNDPALSPVARAFAGARGLPHAYVAPSLDEVFEFVAFYVDFYGSGAGRRHEQAAVRARNASKVRYSIETKLNPRGDRDEHGNVFRDRTAAPERFVEILGGMIAGRGLEARADIQSFDWRTLLGFHEKFPGIRTVCLMGDFPVDRDPARPGTGDGGNLQGVGDKSSPFLAGLRWPYRRTALQNPLRCRTSGGIEGMAQTPDGKHLWPLLEKPLRGGEPGILLVHEFALESRRFTGRRLEYRLDPPGVSIGAFILFSGRHGLVIERDDSQGDLKGFKAVYEVTFRGWGRELTKRLACDLLAIADPRRISGPGLPGDVGIGPEFAFPFFTIEDILYLDEHRIGVLNDNNYPLSVGRHAGTGAPDDNEFIVIRLGEPLGR